METLEKLLSILDGCSSVDSIESTFSKIADILLSKSYIKTVNGNYRILEIEFYFYNKNHMDDVTISRSAEEGMWWLHDWGVDLSFKSDGKNFYGGILIRSIFPFDYNNIPFDVDEKKVIYGPRNCCWELFYSSALKCNMTPQVIINEDIVFIGVIGKTKRYITDKTQKVDGNYRFYIKGLKPINSYKASPWR